jgi:TRAP-type C4-dicarboxylate transport system substrate-binding protein
MKSLNILIGSIFMLSLAANVHSADPVVWRLASGYSDSSFHTANLREFARDVETQSQGSLRLVVHSNNSLVKLGDIRAAVASGAVEMGEVILTGISKEIPMAGADSVPFVVGDFGDAERLWALQREPLGKDLARHGLLALYAVPWPAQGLYTTRPITRKLDFSGSRMRTYNPTTVRIAELLGATPVDVPMVQVGEALASGRMDSMITSAVTGVENKVWSHLKYYYEINAWTPKNAVLVNSKAWMTLPDTAKRALRIASERAEARGWALSRAAASAAVATLKANGVRIEPVPAFLERDFIRLGERFSREWILAAGADASAVFTSYFLKLSPAVAASPVARSP